MIRWFVILQQGFVNVEIHNREKLPALSLTTSTLSLAVYEGFTLYSNIAL